MTTFVCSHNLPGDTRIIINGQYISCLFFSPAEDPETFLFYGSVLECFNAADSFFETGSDPWHYESLSIPAQDAIYNALYYYTDGGKHE